MGEENFAVFDDLLPPFKSQQEDGDHLQADEGAPKDKAE